MAKATVASLELRVAALEAELENVGERLASILTEKLAEFDERIGAAVGIAEVAIAVSARAAAPAKAPKPEYVKPQWQIDRLAAMEVAKAATMAGKTAVKAVFA